MSIKEYKAEACPVCGHAGWCGRREDGLILCKRPPSPSEVSGYVFKGMAQDGVTGMYVEIGKERPPRQAESATAPASPENPAYPAEDRRAHLGKPFSESVAAFTSDRRTALALELGLPEVALGVLPIGWGDSAKHHADSDIRGAFIFPEYDGQGRLTGVTYRFPAGAVAGKTDGNSKPLGNKSAPNGFHRGLTLPVGWKEMCDPVLIAEGASDALAGRAVGLNVIGRPSNSGGGELIAQACRHRQVIVLGENDRKPDGRWPGKEGAELVARRLEAAWDRPVPVAFPPEGTKDLREWVRQLVPDWQNAFLVAARQRVLNAVEPPPLVLMAKAADKRGRATVKVFRWADGVGGIPIHSDRLHIEDAAARKRFARAMAKVEPAVDIDELTSRLLAVKIPPASACEQARPYRHPADSTVQPDVAARAATGSTAQSVSSPIDPLPEVFLPGGPVPITQSAVMLGTLLAKTAQYYLRGGAIVTVGKDDDGRPVLEPQRPAALASVFETVAKLKAFHMDHGQPVPVEAICTEQAGKLIQHSAAFHGFQIVRCESPDPLNRRPTREYRFQLAPVPGDGCAYAPDAHRRTIGADCPAGVNNDPDSRSVVADASVPTAQCAYGAPIGAPMTAPMDSRVAPNAPISSVIAPRRGQNTSTFLNMHEKSVCIGEVMEPIGALGAIGADPVSVVEEDEVLV